MAAFWILQLRRRRLLRRNRLFRDRTHPFEVFDDVEIVKKFRFRRREILDLTNFIEYDITVTNRKGSLTPLLQVLVSLRYFASSSFQDVCAELIGIDQSTVSRVVSRVTDVLCRRAREEIRLPNQRQADKTKRQILQDYGFPNAVGYIDGTQIGIQAPSDQEHEFVNRKGYHSINVQVICDGNLIFINCISKWPGSVHDARILRESSLFDAFESANKPLDGIILGDSGLQRDWLFTPLPHPTTQKEKKYNACHSSARSTVERAIGVLKRRWHCLRRLRLHPAKACKVITSCVMLHNRARRQNVEFLSDSDSSEEEASETDDDSDSEAEDQRCAMRRMSERARVAAGKEARQRLINNYF